MAHTEYPTETWMGGKNQENFVEMSSFSGRFDYLVQQTTVGFIDSKWQLPVARTHKPGRFLEYHHFLPYLCF